MASHDKPRVEVQRQQDGRCGYCMSPAVEMKDPRVLECSHFFCLGCLESDYRRDSLLECAICRYSVFASFHSRASESAVGHNPRVSQSLIYLLYTGLRLIVEKAHQSLTHSISWLKASYLPLSCFAIRSSAQSDLWVEISTENEFPLYWNWLLSDSDVVECWDTDRVRCTFIWIWQIYICTGILTPYRRYSRRPYWASWVWPEPNMGGIGGFTSTAVYRLETQFTQ